MEIPKRDAVASDSLVPEGEYLFRVVNAKEWTAKDTGNVSLMLELQVEEGEWKGAEVTTWVSPKFRKGAALRACIDSLLPNISAEDTSVHPDDLVGKTCLASIVHEIYKAELKEKIDNGSFKPVSEVASVSANGRVDDGSDHPFD